MTRWINRIVLIGIFATSWIGAECDGCIVSDGTIFQSAAFLLSTFALLPIFFGAMFGLFARGRVMKRPGLDLLLFARTSPLQFIWFGGAIFSAAGSGKILGCVRFGISEDAVLILASGIGLILGSAFVVRMFPKRFIKAQTAPFDGAARKKRVD